MYRGGSLSVSLLSNAEFSISRTQANPPVLPQFEQPSRTERPPRPLLPPSSPLPFSPSQWDRGERKERRESSYEVRACSCQPSLHLFPTPAGFLPDPFLSPRPKAKPRQKGNIFSSFILLQAFPFPPPPVSAVSAGGICTADPSSEPTHSPLSPFVSRDRAFSIVEARELLYPIPCLFPASSVTL